MMKSSHHFLKVIGAKVFTGWKDYNALAVNADAYVVQKYQEKQMRKIFEALLKGVKEQKAYLLAVMQKEGEEAKTKEEQLLREAEFKIKLAKAVLSINRLKAKIRGYQWRQQWVEIVTTKLDAIQTMQRFIRMGLGFKEARRRKRKVYARDAIREEKELDKMRVEEQKMRYYNYIMKVIQILNLTSPN